MNPRFLSWQVAGKEKEGFQQRTDSNTKGNELGRDLRFTIIPEELVLVLRCSGTWHTYYWSSLRLSLLLAAAKKICLRLQRQIWQKTPRKNIAGSVKNIQIMPHSTAGYKDLSLYGRAWDLSWTYTRTMTTSSKSPRHTCLWHWSQFINKCQTSSFLTFVANIY